jgi:hypothetical protein
LATIDPAGKLPATADLPPHTTVAKAKTIPAVGVNKILGKKVGIRHYLFGILSIELNLLILNCLGISCLSYLSY